MKRYVILFAIMALMVGLLAAPVGAAGGTATGTDVAGLGGRNIPVLESSTGSYVVVMEADPLVASFDKSQLHTKAAQNKAKGLKKGHDKALKNAGLSADTKVNEYTVALNGFSAVMSYEEAKAVARQDGVALVLPDEMRYPTTDNSPQFLGLTDPAGPWMTGYDGENVIVGVIDTGIWPEHPSFADDGTYSNLGLSIPCEFGNMAHNPLDAPFTCNNKLLGARQMLDTYRALIGAEDSEYDSARDDNGHGTHTASTAAGDSGVEATVLGSELGTISGIAPRARIIAYKGLGTLGGFSSDLAAAIDQAVADGVDVINYSIGGGASLLGADDFAFLFAADAGVFVATSAGNDGPGAGSIGGPASVPWLTSVGASTQDRTFTSTVTLGDGSSYTGLGMGEAAETRIVDAEDLGNELCDPSAGFSDAVIGQIVLCKRGAFPLVDKGTAVYEAGGAGMVLYNQAPGMTPYLTTYAVPTAHITYEDGLAIKEYVETEGTAASASIDGGNRASRKAPWMASFSSRGPDPVAEDIIKPDVTAPGFGILAGYSPTGEFSAAGELFSVIQGTSMASPHVAGVFALIKQAHPDWSPAMAKSALMTTAYQKVRKEDGKTFADPFDIGAGHINPGGNAGKRGSLFEPGLVYDAGFLDYLGFLCDAAPEAFTDPVGTCGFLESIGVPTDASDLNLASIGVADLLGSQTVTRTVTSVAEKPWVFTAEVHAPKGFTVEVNPRVFRIRPGETVAYTVTVTNRNAPAEEWRFGSLTWKAAGYEARSPIALRGALFNAPAAVSGEGTSGSGSFDVGFGYTGDYTAAPHGLSADAPTTDTIGQDPDQTYPSGDDGVGVDKIPFPVSGSAFVRWSLVIPGEDDIDLFLEDSGGNIIASSTNGGTDESIELVLPADDNYTMVVHGWSVPHEPLSYTLHFWDVPLASGGTLSVDSAPASAVLGTTGTVEFSWNGLTSGTSYLGAVSHSDADGIIGLTLVEVAAP